MSDKTEDALVPLVEEGKIKIIYQTNPMDSVVAGPRVIIDVPFEGKTVRQHVLQFIEPEVLDNPENKIVVLLNDERVAREDWDVIVPPAGSLVGVVSVPEFTLIAALAVALSYAALGLGVGVTASGIIGILGAGVITVGALVGLNLLLGAILGPNTSDLDGASGGSNALLLAGASNEARHFRSVPRIYGSWRYTPPIAGSTLTEPSGRFQIIRQLFCWGHGPLEITNYRVGDNEFLSYVDAEVETKTITSGDKVLDLYPRLAKDEQPSVLLRDVSGGTEWFQRTTSEDCVQITCDFLAAHGMKRWGSGKAGHSHEWQVNFELDYRVTGETEWTTWIREKVQNRTEEPFFITFKKTVAAGQYDVRVRTVPVPGYDPLFYPPERGGTGRYVSQLLTDFQWISMKSYEIGNPVEQEGMVVTAIKIRSSEQLSGAINEFNADVTSLLPEITSGLTLTSETATRNPARICLDILTGDANLNPVPLNKIDLQAFYDWQEMCEDEDLTCDIVFDYNVSVFEAFNTVARVGRASLGFNGDKYTVIVDTSSITPTQMFTPRNSKDFTVQRVFGRPLHGARIRFPDRTKNFSAEEVVIYNDGYDASNATEFQSVDSILGLTEYSKVYKHMRYEMLQSRYRPEIYSLTTGLDGLIPMRGDTVRVRNDIPLIGLNQALVTDIGYNGGGSIDTIYVDEPFTYASGTSYSIEARHNEDTSFVSSPVDNLMGTESYVTPSTPLASGILGVGDMVSFGETTSVTEDMKVIGVERSSDLEVKISLVAAAPEIFTTLSGESAPPFDSNITIPGGVSNVRPSDPVIYATTATITGYQTNGDANVRVNASVRPGSTLSGTAVAPTSSYYAQWRPTGYVSDNELHPWVALPEVFVESGQIQFTVEGIYSYDMRVWSVSPDRILSSGTAVVVSGTVVGSALPPTNVRIENDVHSDAYGIFPVMRIRWNAPDGNSAVRYIVRWILNDGSVWVQETSETSFDVYNPQRGIYTISVQAVDLGGNLSEEVSDQFTFEASIIDNPFRVSGLEVNGQGNDTTFEGTDAHVVWRVTNTKNLDVLESGNYGVGEGAQDPFFEDYQVSVIDPVTYAVRRVRYTQNPFFIYSLSDNIEDSADNIPLRQFKISVAARDRNGQIGPASSLIVSNPAPEQLSGVYVNREVSTCYIGFDHPDDPDWAGVMVWASTDSECETTSDNLVLEGSYGSPVAFTLDASTNYYLRAAAYDVFSKNVSDLNVTSTIYATASGLPANTVDEAALQGNFNVANILASGTLDDDAWDVLASPDGLTKVVGVVGTEVIGTAIVEDAHIKKVQAGYLGVDGDAFIKRLTVGSLSIANDAVSRMTEVTDSDLTVFSGTGAGEWKTIISATEVPVEGNGLGGDSVVIVSSALSFRADRIFGTTPDFGAGEIVPLSHYPTYEWRVVRNLGEVDEEVIYPADDADSRTSISSVGYLGGGAVTGMVLVSSGTHSFTMQAKWDHGGYSEGLAKFVDNGGDPSVITLVSGLGTKWKDWVGENHEFQIPVSASGAWLPAVSSPNLGDEHCELYSLGTGGIDFEEYRTRLEPEKFDTGVWMDAEYASINISEKVR